MQSLIIGLFGGIGSGKTTVARLFKKVGSGVIEADKIAHHLLDNELIKKRLCKTFGQTIINKAGKVNRIALARKVFSHKDNLQKLNALIHPYIRKIIKQKLDQQAVHHKVIVIDAALLLESSLAKICDFIIFVDAHPKIRKLRTSARRRWSKTELSKRESFQVPPAEKKKKADFIIDNNSSLIKTYSQIKKIYRRIKND